MARRVEVFVLDGKENTVDETRVIYPVGIPTDVLFYTRDNIRYAQWWNTDVEPKLISVPVSQIVSID